jgi:multidrug resistance efflux pump
MVNQVTPEDTADLQAPASAHRDAVSLSAMMQDHWLKYDPFLTCAALRMATLVLYLYLPGLDEAATSDAYVDVHIVLVAPTIAACVSALRVDDNLRGDLLVDLDPRDFHVATASAAANNEAQLKGQQAIIAQNEAAVAGDQTRPTVPDSLFVTASDRKTQLTNVRPGQAINIRADALPGLPLRGRGGGLQGDAGSEFALLPPENTTANFVKVAQRVPVRNTFGDPGEAIGWISPGMSAETSISFSSAAWLG